ncbi:unnamed protein product [Pedinophyceae sp. YPF-701]|nr:unnamed protein product [Pedinophyceae sp. YPF-701]
MSSRGAESPGPWEGSQEALDAEGAQGETFPGTGHASNTERGAQEVDGGHGGTAQEPSTAPGAPPEDAARAKPASQEPKPERSEAPSPSAFALESSESQTRLTGGQLSAETSSGTHARSQQGLPAAQESSSPALPTPERSASSHPGPSRMSSMRSPSRKASWRPVARGDSWAKIPPPLPPVTDDDGSLKSFDEVPGFGPSASFRSPGDVGGEGAAPPPRSVVLPRRKFMSYADEYLSSEDRRAEMKASLQVPSIREDRPLTPQRGNRARNLWGVVAASVRRPRANSAAPALPAPEASTSSTDVSKGPAKSTGDRSSMSRQSSSMSKGSSKFAGAVRRQTLMQRLMRNMRQSARCCLVGEPPIAIVGSPCHIRMRVVNEDLTQLSRQVTTEDFNMYIRHGPSKSRDMDIHIWQIDERTFDMVWSTNVSGSYSLAITCQHLGIQGSPIELDVKYPVTQPDKSLLQGPKYVRAGREVQLPVMVCDQAGNKRSKAQDELDVRVKGPAILARALIDEPTEGSQVVLLAATRAGEYFVDVKLEDVSFKNCPRKLTVVPAPGFARTTTAEVYAPKTWDALGFPSSSSDRAFIHFNADVVSDTEEREGYFGMRHKEAFVEDMEIFWNEQALAAAQGAEADDAQTMTKKLGRARKGKAGPRRRTEDGVSKEEYKARMERANALRVEAREREAHQEGLVMYSGQNWPPVAAIRPEHAPDGKARDPVIDAEEERRIRELAEAEEQEQKERAKKQKATKKRERKPLVEPPSPAATKGAGFGRAQGRLMFRDAEAPATPRRQSNVNETRGKQGFFLQSEMRQRARALLSIADADIDGPVRERAEKVLGQAGSPVEFVLHLHDRFNNPISGKREPVLPTEKPEIVSGHAELYGTDMVIPLKSHVLEDGRWLVSFTPKRAGVYTPHISVNSEPVPHANFRVRVFAGPGYGPTTLLLRSQEVPEEVVAGTVLRYMVLSRDRYKNPRERGNERVLVNVSFQRGDATKKGHDLPTDGLMMATKALATRLTADKWEVLRSAVAKTADGHAQPQIIGLEIDVPETSSKRQDTQGAGALSHLLPEAVRLAGVKTEVTDLSNGVYQVEIRLAQAGMYDVAVGINDRLVKKGRFSLGVVPGTCEPSKCKASGQGIRKAEAGISGAFWVSTHDKYGNQLRDGSARIECRMTGPEELDAVVINHGDGTYRVSYWARQAGTYRMVILCNDVQVLGTPRTVIVSPPKSRRTAYVGEGFRTALVGHPATFRARLLDQSGEYFLGDALAAIRRHVRISHLGIEQGMKSPICIQLEMLEGTDSRLPNMIKQFWIERCKEFIARHRVQALRMKTMVKRRAALVEQERRLLEGGPSAAADAAPASDEPSESAPGGAEESQSTVGRVPASTAVLSAENTEEEEHLSKLLRAVRREEDAEDLWMRPPRIVPVHLHNNPDGSSTAEYVPSVAGQFAIRALRFVPEATIPEPLKEKEDVWFDGMVGEDPYSSPFGGMHGRPHVTPPESEIGSHDSGDGGRSVSPVKAPEPIQIVPKPKPPGRWIDVTPTYILSKVVPTVTIAHGAPSGPHCVILGDNVSRYLDWADLLPKPLRPGSGGSQHSSYIEETEVVGKHAARLLRDLQRRIRQEEIANDPATAGGVERQKPPKPEAPPPELKQEMTAGNMSKLLLLICDENGNMATSGSGEVRFESELLPQYRVAEGELRGRRAHLNCRLRPSRAGDGTVHVSVEADFAGEYLLKFALMGKFWPNLTCRVHVKPTRTHPEACVAYGPGLMGCNAGEESIFHIEARDVYTNRRNEGGDRFSVSVAAVSDKGLGRVRPAKADITDLGNGLYRVKYSLDQAGAYNIAVNYLGDPLEDTKSHLVCQKRVVVQAGRATGVRCTARGPGLKRAAMGVPAIVAVLIRDDMGNSKSVEDTHGPQSTLHRRGLAARIYPKGKVADPSTHGLTTVTMASVALRDADGKEHRKTLTGMYNIIFRARSAGPHALEITLDGHHIQGSPFSVPVEALDVQSQGEAAVVASMGWHPERDFAWVEDGSGGVLRAQQYTDAYKDIYGYEELLAMLLGDGTESVSYDERSPRGSPGSSLRGGSASDSASASASASGRGKGKDEGVVEQKSAAERLKMVMKQAAAKQGAESAQAGMSKEAQRALAAGGKRKMLTVGGMQVEFVQDKDGTMHVTGARKQSRWARIGQQVRDTAVAWNREKMSNEVGRIMLKPRVRTKAEQALHLDRQLQNTTRRQTARLAARVKRLAEAFQHGGDAQGAEEEDPNMPLSLENRTAYRELKAQLESRALLDPEVAQHALNQKSLAQRLLWTHDVGMFREKGYDPTRDVPAAAARLIEAREREGRRMEEQMARLQELPKPLTGPQPGVDHEIPGEGLLPHALESKYNIRFKRVEARARDEGGGGARDSESDGELFAASGESESSGDEGGEDEDEEVEPDEAVEELLAREFPEGIELPKIKEDAQVSLGGEQAKALMALLGVDAMRYYNKALVAQVLDDREHTLPPLGGRGRSAGSARPASSFKSRVSGEYSNALLRDEGGA